MTTHIQPGWSAKAKSMNASNQARLGLSSSVGKTIIAAAAAPCGASEQSPVMEANVSLMGPDDFGLSHPLNVASSHNVCRRHFRQRPWYRERAAVASSSFSPAADPDLVVLVRACDCGEEVPNSCHQCDICHRTMHGFCGIGVGPKASSRREGAESKIITVDLTKEMTPAGADRPALVEHEHCEAPIKSQPKRNCPWTCFLHQIRLVTRSSGAEFVRPWRGR